MKRILGHYEILEKLGEGGMGVVYKARDLRLGRIVALKMLSGERLDTVQRERLVREAKTASALNHPNIVTIYDIDSSDGIQLVSMEYVAGKSLAELVRLAERVGIGNAPRTSTSQARQSPRSQK